MTTSAEELDPRVTVPADAPHHLLKDYEGWKYFEEHPRSFWLKVRKNRWWWFSSPETMRAAIDALNCAAVARACGYTTPS